MKVLQVINNLKREGAQKMLLDIFSDKTFANSQIDIALIQPQNAFVEKIKGHKNINILVLGKKKYDLRIFVRLYKLISVRNYDVIHSHLFPSNYYCGLMAFFLTREHFVTTEHSTSNTRRKYFLFKIIESFVFKKYKVIIAISKATKLSLEKHLVCGNFSIQTINNGINFEELRTALKSALEPGFQFLDKIGTNNNILIVIGRFSKLKNHTVVIEAMKLLETNYHLVLVGDGETKSDLINKVQIYDLNDRVHFVGLQKNIGQFIKLADIAILPSLWEGFGLAAIETMFCETPTVVSDVIGLSEVVGDSALKFPSNDSKVLAEKIQTLMNDEDLKKEMIEKGKRKAREYDIRITAKKYKHLYRDAL